MLVPFGIDADSLVPDPDWTSPQKRSCHHNLLDTWQSIGLLVHDGEKFEGSGLDRAVKELPQNLRMLWQGALKQSPPVPCRNDWNGTVTSSNTEEVCAVASLALVDDVHAEAEFGMDEDQDEISIVSADANRLVVSRLLAANHASVIKDALAISQQNIERGESYSDIWGLRFHSLAAAVIPDLKRVAIIDRYTVEQHFKCPQDRLSGLERFLRLLDVDAGGKRYVTVYSAWTADLAGKNINDVENEMNNVIQRLPKTNVKRLTVHMVPNHKFGAIARDRYVRFGRYVWELGHGLDVFQGPASSHLCQASFKSDADSHLRVEKDLYRETKPSEIDIRR